MCGAKERHAGAEFTEKAANDRPELRLNMVKYADLFIKSFEGQLGIDDTRLDAAFTGAAADTIDQASKDGVVTADQAAQPRPLSKMG